MTKVAAMTFRVDAETRAIGQAARGAVAEADMTQDEVARAIGLSLSSLSRRLNGQLPFTYPELVRLADTTGVTVGDLVARAERILGQDLAAS